MFTIIIGRGKNRLVYLPGEYDEDLVNVFLKGYIKKGIVDG